MSSLEVPTRTRGEEYESLAFTFCKIATVVALTGKWALPVAAGCSAVLYVLAFTNGKKDTRCVLRYPLLISFLWGSVALITLWKRAHQG
jgi:hypothetical protein